MTTNDATLGGAEADSVGDATSDRLAERLLAWPLTVLVGLICLMQLLTWVPHYLTWPLWADHDVFATIARGWEAGVLPYRDLYCNQFPGALYLFWILGRIAGWGHSWPIYAFDAAAMLGLGLGLVVWSRRFFGRALPGLVGYLAFLSYYLSLDYMMAAQRDWHSALLAVLGILVLQTSPGRILGPAVSGAAMSMALCFRPHAAVFLPAVALQFLGEIRGGGGVRRLASWAGSFLAHDDRLDPPAGGERDPAGLRGGGRAQQRGERGAGPARRRDGRQRAQAARHLQPVVVAIAIALLPKPDRSRALGAAVWLAALGLVAPLRADQPEVPLVPEDSPQSGPRGERRDADAPPPRRRADPAIVQAPLAPARAGSQLPDPSGVLRPEAEPQGGGLGDARTS